MESIPERACEDGSGWECHSPVKRAIAGLVVAGGILFAQASTPGPAFDAFEVAAIKPADPEAKGRYIRMRGTHEFVANGFTLNALVAAAYSLNPKHQISGGAAWTDSERYDILAGTTGAAQPNPDEQMRMLRKLLTDRFQLTFHLEHKEVPIYALTVAKSGSKLKDSTAAPDKLPDLTNVVYEDHLKLPARNATMGQLAAMMRRAVLDRPVVDQTGLHGKYDFDLEWTPDDTQFDGQLHMAAPADGPPKPDLFAAMQQQLGLRLTSTKGPAEVFVIDRVEKPSEN